MRWIPGRAAFCVPIARAVPAPLATWTVRDHLGRSWPDELCISPSM